MDMNKFVTSVGVRYDVNASIKLTGSFTNVFYLSRTTEPRAADPMNPSRSPDNAGEYSQLINLLTLGGQYSF
jgi:hypothetical protein